ncbi:MAG: hypothetical protein KUA43_08830 [Hoeflea sp.]|uniref:hypothetical protein n=1 Tax=Hoeflea sp. TaxID=1940281 RepID=UPI001D261688|nr:hypothetical protein [Hoeflea sp.]MBU4529769.1 hypothetical protein [Alphaproteobacteria bacterium]MBU4543330.1 hypothetical protein [Alphaproteobacteria bacterium]MBU4552517.1 hypothetical protein [Alphaproteobacteria bacterium]MBV1723533.1 hypothetical protein [Hoeflea sp.]MBV1762982.1 hypothetical protein [Hoeflea sp.]
MSAINVFLTDEAAHVFTDGAMYDLDAGGKILGVCSKPLTLPHLNAVIASTGYIYVNYMLMGAICDSRVSSFDELKDHFGAIVKKASAEALKIPGMPKGLGFFETVIAGWSERADRPQAYAMDRGFGGLDASRPMQTRKVYRKPDHPELPKTKRTEHVEADGLSLMEDQRRLLFGSHDAPGLEAHAVGGFCQMTTVTRDGISMKILRRWPDFIGEPISVTPDAASSTLF